MGAPINQDWTGYQKLPNNSNMNDKYGAKTDVSALYPTNWGKKQKIFCQFVVCVLLAQNW